MKRGILGVAVGLVLVVLAAAIFSWWWFKPVTITYSPTEEAWIGSLVVREIEHTLCYTANKTSGSARPISIRVESPRPGTLLFHVAERGSSRRSIAVNLEPGIWSPTVYAELTRELISRHRVATQAVAAPKVERDLPEVLLDPDVAVLEKQNHLVSDALSSHPVDYRLHEEAALLNALLAFNEASGAFYDARGALSSVAAQLSIAEELRHGAPMTESGHLASALLQALSGRQADARAAPG